METSTKMVILMLLLEHMVLMLAELTEVKFIFIMELVNAGRISLHKKQI